MPGFQVVGQLGVGGEGGGVQAGRGVVQFLELAPLGEGEAFVVIGRRVGAILVEGEFGPSPSNPLAVGRGVGRRWDVDQHAPDSLSVQLGFDRNAQKGTHHACRHSGACLVHAASWSMRQCATPQGRGEFGSGSISLADVSATSVYNTSTVTSEHRENARSPVKNTVAPASIAVAS